MSETTKPAKSSVRTKLRNWRGSWLGISALVLLLWIAWAYWSRTQLPSVVRIASGPAEGRYADIAQGIAQELRDRFQLTVEVIETGGSLENLHLLQSQEVDFGLYQPGTLSILDDATSQTDQTAAAAFVSNLYPEFLLPIGSITQPDNAFESAGSMKLACNDLLSGDYAVSRLMLRHLGIDMETKNLTCVDYADIAARLQDKSIDVSIVCCGVDAPILKTLFTKQVARPLPIPALDAFARRNPSMTRDEIPAGYFQAVPPIPSHNYSTVTLQAQLLATPNASVRLVEEVTRIVSDRRFQLRHSLTGLFAGGIEYATDRPEFQMHSGASHVFYPELKPLLNPDFVEGTEGIRSFVVSLIAAIWLLQRWWNQQKIRGQEHKLDRYIKALLKLERDQMDVDGEGSTDESSVLQKLLDEVTILRQEALAEFTAHELNEDRAVDCFIQMCHALSDKINSKLIRNCLLLTKRQ
ncbi:MAG: TAXI family TRAP transporter solute-binding subunit [Fuerstiella sp.]